MEIPYLVVDYNHQIVRKLREEGINVIYGDPAEIDVLRFANLDKAKIVIIAYSDRTMQEIDHFKYHAAKSQYQADLPDPF